MGKKLDSVKILFFLKKIKFELKGEEIAYYEAFFELTHLEFRSLYYFFPGKKIVLLMMIIYLNLRYLCVSDTKTKLQ